MALIQCSATRSPRGKIRWPWLLLLILTAPLSAQAATHVVGACPGATHGDFETAYNGFTTGGPHTIQLCPGIHTTSAVTANWRHADLTIESLSGNPADTELRASGATLMTTAHQHFTIRNLSFGGDITVGNSGSPFRFINVVADSAIASGSANLIFEHAQVTGNITSGGGRVELAGGRVTGDIRAQNGVLTDATDVVGDITATNGPIALAGGLIEGAVGTAGNSQPITLTGVIMPGGSVHTAGATVTIHNSTLGSGSSTVPVTANNGITVTDSEIWGDLTARTWATIFLNSATVVYGNCDPTHTGGGYCGEAPESACSDRIGQATINEVHRQGNAARFVEIRILNSAITMDDYRDWTISMCSSRRSPCITVGLDDGAIDHSAYPWLLLTMAGIPHQNYIDFGHGAGNGMEIRLDDADGRAIDYLSVAGYTDELSVDCPFPYDTTMTSTNAHTIMRLPDGVGDWAISGPGNSGTPTPGESNDGEPSIGLVYEALMEQSEWTGAAGEVLDSSGRGLHGRAEGATRTAVASPALPGDPGSCRYGVFNGDDSGIFVGNEIDYGFGNELTVMAWVRWSIDPADGHSWANIVTSNATTGSGDNGQFWLQHSQDNDAFEIAVQTDEVRRFQLSDTVPQQGIWYHVAGVYDGPNERLRLYVNGILEGHRSIQGSSVAAAAGNATHIGRWSRPGYRRFTGDIDEVRAFTRALDAAEIQQWMNTVRECPEAELDAPHHIRLRHGGSGLTCEPERITVLACADADCTGRYTDAVTVEFSASPGGIWTPDPLTFDGGEAQVALRVTTPGVVTLDAEATEPATDHPTRCFDGVTESCELTFAEAGFVFDVPDQIAGRPSAPIAIRALATDPDNPAVCGAAFEGERTVRFWSHYEAPGDGGMPVHLNGSPDNPIAASAPGTAIVLNFGSNGTAQLDNLRYDDAGLLRLHARFLGSGEEAGLVLEGNDGFVVRPEGLCVRATDNASLCPAADVACSVFRAAGQGFELQVRAVRWEEDDADLCDNRTTPNFRHARIALDHRLVAPVGGAPGTLGHTEIALTAADQGDHRLTDQSLAEVGVFTIDATPDGLYHGVVVPGGSSVNIGRFVPDHLLVTPGLATAACTAGARPFTYYGEDGFATAFTLRARNTAGATTRNYTGRFARFDPGRWSDYAFQAEALPPSVLLMDGANSPSGHWNQGVAQITATHMVTRHAPVDPTHITVTARPVDADGVTLPARSAVHTETTELRYGRLELHNAHGPEILPLNVPLFTAYYVQGAFRRNRDDDCTALAPACLNWQAGGFDPAYGSDRAALVHNPAAEGRIDLTLAAPGAENTGHVDLGFDLSVAGCDRPWLRYDWGSGSRDPAARAGFGVYRGPYVDIREHY